LESIVSQLCDEVEIVIVDGGSTDCTEEIVGSYQKLFQNIRYQKKNTFDKKPTNEGFDRDCDQAVMLASGEYCWLMTDDDLLKPGAIGKILLELVQHYHLIVVNAEVRSNDFSKLLIQKRPKLQCDRTFDLGEWSEFAVTAANHLTFVGAVIIRRELWTSRNREKYFGSGFVHVGVIFDEPIKGRILVTSEPLVTIRFGNAQWTSRSFQIWMISWPSLIWSFPDISDAAKALICPREPWRSLKTLLFNRALGVYSVQDYSSFIEGMLTSKFRRQLSKYIAKFPRILLYAPAFLYIRLRLPDSAYVLFNLRENQRLK
jgi:glycosyltransferase involved in cell wall biosynthesis